MFFSSPEAISEFEATDRRILGKCPACGVRDSLKETKDPNMTVSLVALCEACHRTWENFFDLIESERLEGNRLMKVEVQRNWRSASLVWHSSRVPFKRLIVSVLNTALIARFGLRVNFACEGGVEGMCGREYIELRNGDDGIGLYDAHLAERNPRCRAILRWYSEALYWLFIGKLAVGRHDFGRGSILWLNEEHPGDETNAKILLWAAICRRTRSKKFSAKVFEQLKIEMSGPGRHHLAGLSDEDIARLWVPPPV